MITKDEYSWEGNTFKNHESLNITFGNLSDWARGKIPPLAVQVMQTLGNNSTYNVFQIDGNYCSTSKWFMITTTAAQLCQSTLVIKKLSLKLLHKKLIILVWEVKRKHLKLYWLSMNKKYLNVLFEFFYYAMSTAIFVVKKKIFYVNMCIPLAQTWRRMDLEHDSSAPL